MNDSKKIDTEGLARRLRISPRTVEGWRVRGGGPPFLRIGRGRGRIIYDLADVEIWLVSCRRISTSDTGHEAIK